MSFRRSPISASDRRPSSSRRAPSRRAEGYYYEQVTENYVISDGTRNMNIYYVHPLAHAEGMLMAYLPGERMIVQADLVDTHVPLPAAPTPAHRTFYNEVRTLGIDVSQIVPIHGKPIPWSEFIKVIGS